MDSIKETLNDMSEMFYKKMSQFEKSLQESTAVTQTKDPAKIQEEFFEFKKLVIFALNSLQKQVDSLSMQCDKMEMHARMKMLLVHGVPEEEKENIPGTMSKFFNDHISGQALSSDSFTKCIRLGRFKKDKPRPILIKFRTTELRNKIWFSKTSLKGTGVSISEFLTKYRYRIFLEARQRFGMTKCWTKDGNIHVLAPNGSRHRVICVKDLDGIVGPKAPDSQGTSDTAHTATAPSILTRSKRHIVKK